MKKKMLKPEIEFIKFETADVITTSGGGDTFIFNQANPTTTSGNAHDNPDYSNGTNNLWNLTK